MRLKEHDVLSQVSPRNIPAANDPSRLLMQVTMRKEHQLQAHLVEVGGGNFPGAAGKVDVVRVMHLAQVVEAAALHPPAI